MRNFLKSSLVAFIFFVFKTIQNPLSKQNINDVSMVCAVNKNAAALL